MDEPTPVGEWDIGFREFTVVAGGDGLLVRFPEVEAGFEGRLRRIDAGRYLFEGGAYPGAELILDESGWSLGGVLPLSPLDRPAQAQPGSGLRPPAIDFTPAEEARCADVWARVDHPSQRPDVDLDGMAAHRFVQWLMDDFAGLAPGQRWRAVQRELKHWPTPHHTDDKTLVVLVQRGAVLA